MKTDLAGPTSSSKIDATGHYDPARRLVLDLHEVNTFSGSSPAGSNSGTATTDFKLQ